MDLGSQSSPDSGVPSPIICVIGLYGSIGSLEAVEGTPDHESMELELRNLVQANLFDNLAGIQHTDRKSVV